MDTFIIIKNGIVLTLDRADRAGVYTIVIKNNKIVEIDFDGKFEIGKFVDRYPQTQLVDAQNKIILPGFFNSNVYSTFSLNKLFFKKCTYDSLKDNQALQLIDKYLSLVENVPKRKNIFRINYLKSILAGEVNLVESSGDVAIDQLDEVANGSGMTVNVISYENNKSDNAPLDAKSFSGVRGDEQINMYLVNNLKNLTNSGDVKLFLEVYQNEKDLADIKDLFRKSLIYVLKDYNLLTASTILSNPVYLSKNEFDVLNSTRTNVVLSPSDIINFYPRNFDFRNYIYSDLNVSIGTGFTGKNVLSEIKLISAMSGRSNKSYKSLMKMITYNGAFSQGISNLSGTIEKNKMANIVFFDLNRLSSFASLPDVDSEKICEYIIDNLNTENISDVIINGKFEVKDYNHNLSIDYNPLRIANELSSDIYKNGNYSEFAEKQSYNKRQEQMNEELMDKTYIGTGFDDIQNERLIEFGEEFRVVKKENDDVQPLDTSFLPGSVNSLEYISSYDSDFNFLIAVEETAPPKYTNKEDVKFAPKKISFEESEEAASVEAKEKPKAAASVKKEEPAKEKFNKEELKKEEPKPVTFKKVKLRFGFSEDNKDNK